MHPGEILREEFPKPLNLSAYAVAAALNVPRTRIERIAREEKPVTADTALRLGKFFKTGAAFWMNIQARFDLETAEDALAPQIKKIAEYSRGSLSTLVPGLQSPKGVRPILGGGSAAREPGLGTGRVDGPERVVLVRFLTQTESQFAFRPHAPPARGLVRNDQPSGVSGPTPSPGRCAVRPSQPMRSGRPATDA